MLTEIEFVRNILKRQIKPVILENPSIPNFSSVADNLEYRRIGLDLLRENKVAVLMVAGGLSTRMGLPENSLRGDLPIGPVTARTIFDIHGQSISAIKQKYSPLMPWLVMTSQSVHDMTMDSFKRKNYYGISRSQIWFFAQDSLPLIDGNDHPVVDDSGELVRSPTGHGGMYTVLEKKHIWDKLKRNGIEYIFYFQYPNVLEKVCDPVILGFHHSGGHDITTKAILEYDPVEKMGRCTNVDGKLRIIEYHDLEHYSHDFLGKIFPASIATHVWSIAFLDRCMREGIELPYHIIEQSNSFDAPKPIRRLEQFIFDLFPYARRNELFVVRREDEFAPVKQKEGLYSLDNARKTLNRCYLKWMRDAGAVNRDFGKECVIEIRPSFALDFQELKAKISPGFKYGDKLVLI